MLRLSVEPEEGGLLGETIVRFLTAPPLALCARQVRDHRLELFDLSRRGAGGRRRERGSRAAAVAAGTGVAAARGPACSRGHGHSRGAQGAPRHTRACGVVAWWWLVAAVLLLLGCGGQWAMVNVAPCCATRHFFLVFSLLLCCVCFVREIRSRRAAEFTGNMDAR